MEKGRRLLWVDCISGLVAGVVMFLAGHWLSAWYGLPMGLIYVMGLVNLLYASYSFSLAKRALPSRSQIALLVSANLAWGLICVMLAREHWGSASCLGRAHFLAEGAYVGVLACLEWRFRDRL